MQPHRFERIRSDRPGQEAYRVGLDAEGKALFCSCPGYRYHGKCKHLERAELAAPYRGAREYLVVTGTFKSQDHVDAWFCGRVKHHEPHAGAIQAAVNDVLDLAQTAYQAAQPCHRTGRQLTRQESGPLLPIGGKP